LIAGTRKKQGQFFGKLERGAVQQQHPSERSQRGGQGRVAGGAHSPQKGLENQLQKSHRALGHALEEGLSGQGASAQQSQEHCPATIRNRTERDQQASSLHEQSRSQLLGRATHEPRSASQLVERKF